MFDNIINQYRPHFESAAAVCRGYADRIVTRLDTLIALASEEDFIEKRRFFPTPVTAVGITDVGIVPTVPTTQVWEIEAVNIAGQDPTVAIGGAATGAVHIIVDGIPRLTFDIAAGSFGKFTPLPDSTQLQGGAQIQIRTVGLNAAAFVQLQVKIRNIGEGKHTNHTGSPFADEYEPDHNSLNPDPKQEAELTGRHAAPGVLSAPNPIGERRGNGVVKIS